MQFYKYQGTGNDFILIDDREGNFDLNTSGIERLCHRRFGIGADGLILLQVKDGQWYMQYFNSDGRESSMCGNGGRCFARFIIDLGLAEDEVAFNAIDGPHKANLMPNGEIALQMKDVDGVQLINQQTFEVNTGSPHYVQFMEEPVADLQLVQEARQVRYNEPYSKEGINVNYVNLKGLKTVQLRTYERGVEDETLSCGTGATAAALCGALFMGFPDGTHKVKVEVEGGVLHVGFHKIPGTSSFKDIWLTGPAVKTFEGEISL